MGSVADKIAKKIAAQGRSKVIDLAAWREGKEIAREAGLDDDRLAHLLLSVAANSRFRKDGSLFDAKR